MDDLQHGLNSAGVRGHMGATGAAVALILQQIGISDPDLANSIRIGLIEIQAKGAERYDDPEAARAFDRGMAGYIEVISKGIAEGMKRQV